LKLYAETIITPQELTGYTILNKKIVMKKSNNILIKGKVLDLKNNAVQGAVIFVKSINHNFKPPKIKDEAYAITNLHGVYAISVEKIHNVIYKLDIYESLIKASSKEPQIKREECQNEKL
jgi:hypothetical protein